MGSHYANAFLVLSKMGEYIREKMEIEMVDSVDELEDVKNGMGGSSRGNDSNGFVGTFDLNQNGEPEWVRVYNHSDKVVLEIEQDTIEITPIQVEALHSLLGVILRERDNVQ